jgi:hypothetical protein
MALRQLQAQLLTSMASVDVLAQPRDHVALNRSLILLFYDIQLRLFKNPGKIIFQIARKFAYLDRICIHGI